jgi:hypothetical protein
MLDAGEVLRRREPTTKWLWQGPAFASQDRADPFRGASHLPWRASPDTHTVRISVSLTRAARNPSHSKQAGAIRAPAATLIGGGSMMNYKMLGAPAAEIEPAARLRAELAERVRADGRGEAHILAEHAWRMAALPDDDVRLGFIAAAQAIRPDVLESDEVQGVLRLADGPGYQPGHPWYGVTPFTDDLVDVVIQAVAAAILSQPADFSLREVLAVAQVSFEDE